MPYSATVRRLLISCPGDIPAEDMHIVQKSINRWNGIYGPSFASSVVPISWGTHAAAEFGRSPQEALNDQLVDQCDICIAMFANRLGTPTGRAESGTAEEIQRLHEAGRYVGILRSRRQADMASVDLEQAQRLARYLDSIREVALVLEYRTDSELENHVDAIIVAAVTRDRARADVQIETTPTSKAPAAHSGTVGSQGEAQLWARIESVELARSVRAFASGSRQWKLVLTNTGAGPAHNVRFSLESLDGDQGGVWEVVSDGTDEYFNVELLPAGAEVSFSLVITLGSAPKVRCVMTWLDSRGEVRSEGTLRLR